jgi:hypothetical protein
LEVNWPAVAALAELLGAVAVVVSLLYVAAQVRQSTAQAQRDASSTFAARFSEIINSWTHDRATIDLFVRGGSSFESMDLVDQTRYRALMQSYWRMLEDQYYQHAAGALDAERWAAASRTMADYLSLPGIQRFLVDRGHWFTPEFIDFCWALTPGKPEYSATPLRDDLVAGELSARGRSPEV